MALGHPALALSPQVGRGDLTPSPALRESGGVALGHEGGPLI